MSNYSYQLQSFGRLPRTHLDLQYACLSSFHVILKVCRVKELAFHQRKALVSQNLKK